MWNGKVARREKKLTARQVAAAKTPGKIGDGGGLWLFIGPSGGKSWVYRYALHGKAREMGLGPWPAVSLEAARKATLDARGQVAAKVDPLREKQAHLLKQKASQAKIMTFQQCAEAYMAAHRKGWKNPKHAAQWEQTLSAFAYPVVGKLPVQNVELAHVMKILEPLWSAKPETASRLRGRIESVLAWATVRGFRHGDNPAAWRGRLSELLPARAKVKPVEHFAALPYERIGAFVAALRQQPGTAALAFEFLILTATRTGETIGARWQEVDFDKEIWTIPAARMKAGKEHRVPLSARALEILKAVAPLRDSSDFIFPGAKPKKPLSTMTFLMILRRLGVAVTAHGFRSTFRDWAGETTAFPREVIEHAMAHQLKDQAEAAYSRGTLLEKRHRLMQAWAQYCGTVRDEKGAVVPLLARNA
jgi:integrase